MKSDTHRELTRWVLLFSAPKGKIEKKGGEHMTKLETLKKWIGESEHIVFFGGAGVSTEIR